MPRLLLALVALSLSAHIASAQTVAPTATFDGSWRFDVTPRGGVSMPSTSGTLTITPRGDSLHARVEWIPGSDGRSAPPRSLRGRMHGDTAIFVEESQGAVSAESHSSSVRTFVTWSLVRREQALAGAITFEVMGMSVPFEPLPLRAVRAGS